MDCLYRHHNNTRANWDKPTKHLCSIYNCNSIDLTRLDGFPKLLTFSIHYTMFEWLFGKSFEPEKDIPSLAGKVVLVTGGEFIGNHRLETRTDS